ncbi:MAG: F0F1 ATP synthase subunit B [Candidatus Binatia bacterium]|nr:F0F1 ATP synthase subunit B [Candidatus Binatia bacterium]
MLGQRWWWLALPCVPAVAWAAGPGGHGADEAHGGIPWATLFFTFVNFALFVWLLARYVWPQVRLWLRERHTAVVEELEAAARARKEAEELRAEWQRRLAQLDAEVAQLRQQVEADLARERERVLEQARRTAEAIRKDAERTVAAELRRLEEELRSELVQQAVAIAREIVRRNWGSAEQERAVEDFVRQVQG